ncbi:MAG: four helix bundle protein [Bacteroidota bacterium]
MGYREMAERAHDGDNEVFEVREPSGRYAPVRHYTDLEVWRMAMDVTDAVYNATKTFPKTETFGLASQLQRAAISIPSNIAEGWGRGRSGEYVQFLRYARGSLYEVETQLRIAARRGYVEQDTLRSLLDQTASISRMLVALMKALR